MKIRRFSTTDSDFDKNLKELLAFDPAQDDSGDVVVASIL
jgi:histidinol dehydrogenase